jgi:hypothetical protein
VYGCHIAADEGPESKLATFLGRWIEETEQVRIFAKDPQGEAPRATPAACRKAYLGGRGFRLALSGEVMQPWSSPVTLGIGVSHRFASRAQGCHIVSGAKHLAVE